MNPVGPEALKMSKNDATSVRENRSYHTQLITYKQEEEESSGAAYVHKVELSPPATTWPEEKNTQKKISDGEQGQEETA